VDHYHTCEFDFRRRQAPSMKTGAYNENLDP